MFKKIALIPVLLLPLTGCVPVVFVAAGATTGTMIARDPRGSGIAKQDRQTTVAAQRAINQDRAISKHSHISVVVYNRVALMVGQAQSPELRDQAYQIVSNIPNINHVYNQVKISGSISLLQRTNDSWLTSKVKTFLVNQKGLPSGNIKIVTENSVVYLMGLVTPAQGEMAANTARRVDGVREVVKVFQYR